MMPVMWWPRPLAQSSKQSIPNRSALWIIRGALLLLVELKHVEARCGEEVAQPGDGADPFPELARLEMELGFVMGVDEIEHTVQYAEGALAYGTLEFLNWAFAALYVKQLGNHTRLLTEQLEHASVHEYRQQMEPGQMREKLALAYLLVSAERHLPGREGHEHKSIGLEQRLAFGDEALLIGYMLYDVVAHNQVKTVFQLLEFEDIGRDESGGNAFLLKILDG